MKLMADIGFDGELDLTVKWKSRDYVEHEAHIKGVLTPQHNVTQLEVSVNSILVAIQDRHTKHLLVARERREENA